MRISNRAFWGVIVLCSSYLMGSAIAQSDVFKTRRIEARELVITNDAGETVISLGTTKKDGTPILLVGRGINYVSLQSGKGGPIVQVHDAKQGVIVGTAGINGPFASTGSGGK